jgi:Arc/MetJ-type ribon-helix-helix transcriptional regulator
MRQKRKLQQKRTKSRAWLEAECLKIARRTLGGSEIQLVTIRRLAPSAGPNWKVADIIPQPTAPVSEVVRAALAHLPDAYHLEEE